MKNILFLITLVFLISGCKKNKGNGELTDELIVVDGRTRAYLQYLPEEWDTQSDMPVVFVLHGGNIGTPQNTMNGIDYRELADAEKFIVVYPAGVEKNWNDGRPTDANQLGVDDVDFFRKMIDKLVATYQIDENAVFATGISNGGFMSSRLGCELSDRIAAIAVVAATIEQNTVFANCDPSTPVSAIYIHGTDDGFVPINGGEMTQGDGGSVVSHMAAIEKWVDINNTSVTPVVTDLPDIANDGTTIMESDYQDGDNGTQVIGYVIENGGHTWPLSTGFPFTFIVGKTSKDMDAKQVIWDFFKTHKR